MNPKFTIYAALLCGAVMSANAADRLTGTPIGTARCFDYESRCEVACTAANLFDNNYNTYFATVDDSYTWAGLDLGSRHVISRVGWSPRNSATGPQRVVLGVIQGANREDFLDAVPLYIITEQGTTQQMSYADVDCSLGFRYVRYVGPAGSQSHLSELAFYGTPGDGDKSHLYQLTNIPTVSINTVDSQEPYDKETDIVGYATILNNNAVDTEAPLTIRERGNASREFPKKPWRLKFDKKQRVLGAPAKAKKWTLLNNYGDKSLIRNLIAFEIAKRLGMEYVPFGRAVDVVLNGEYKGTYQLCDQVEVNENRVNIEEMTTADIDGDALTGGYLVEVDAYAYSEPEGEWFAAAYGLPVTIKSPDAGGTPEQHSYIKNYMSKLVNTLFDDRKMSDAYEGYRTFFDVESFLKHFMVGELTGNTDTYWSTYMYKRRLDPMLYTGPVWDFDLAFDNDNRTYPSNNIYGFLYSSGRASSAAVMKDLTDRIIKIDTATPDDIRRIWSAARNTNDLTATGLSAYIEKLAGEVKQSQRLNFMRWPIMQTYVHMNPRVPSSYDAEISFIKNYLSARIKKLDPLMHYDAGYTTVAEMPTDSPDWFNIAGQQIHVASGMTFSVYSIDGRLVYTGCDHTPILPEGIYILACGTRRIKLGMRN